MLHLLNPSQLYAHTCLKTLSVNQITVKNTIEAHYHLLVSDFKINTFLPVEALVIGTMQQIKDSEEKISYNFEAPIVSDLNTERVIMQWDLYGKDDSGSKNKNVVFENVVFEKETVNNERSIFLMSCSKRGQKVKQPAFILLDLPSKKSNLIKLNHL